MHVSPLLPLLLASKVTALTLYTNTPLSTGSPSTDLTASASTLTQDAFNAFILQGLGPHITEMGEPRVSARPRDTTFSTLPRASDASHYTASLTSNYPLHNNVFTATPRVSTAAQAMSQAMQCWSEIATWRNQSASFWNAQVAGRTWSITSSWSSLSTDWTRTSTIYPSSVITYSLCDGTPRTNVRPKIATFTGVSTLSGSITATLTPTFTARPCTLRPSDCRILYQDTNIEDIDDREILRQCGSSVHVVGDAQWLVGGGPVEIIDFPIIPDDTKLCQSNNATISRGPLIPGMSEISTLGASVSGMQLSVNPESLVVGDATLTASTLRKPTATRTAYVVASGSFTLSATSVKGHSEAVQIGTATLSIGGPVATVSGPVLTKGTKGVVLASQESRTSLETALPSVVIANEKPGQAVVLAAGSHTVTAVMLTGEHTAISVGGTTLSMGGDAAVIQNATFTVGPGGLGVVRPHTARVRTSSTLPSVVLSSASTSSRWSSSAPGPTTLSGASREKQNSALVLLSASSLILLLCM